MTKLRLSYHSIEEWIALQSARLKSLGCSDEYIGAFAVRQYERYELER